MPAFFYRTPANIDKLKNKRLEWQDLLHQKQDDLSRFEVDLNEKNDAFQKLKNGPRFKGRHQQMTNCQEEINRYNQAISITKNDIEKANYYISEIEKKINELEQSMLNPWATKIPEYQNNFQLQVN